MTIDYARTLCCPYKPINRTLDGDILPSCEPIRCMCWVQTSKVTYTDTFTVAYDYIYKVDSNKYTYIGSRNDDAMYGIQHQIPQGYCTLRGDIDDKT